MELLVALESTRARDVELGRSELAAMMQATRESWLVNGLVSYQVRTGSVRAAEVLARCPEHHARHLMDKLVAGVSGDWRGAAFTLLGHIVRRQPMWLPQMASHPLLAALLKQLQNERDATVLVSGVLVLATLLPLLPGLVTKHLHDILDIVKRLAAYDAAAGDCSTAAASARKVHLQLALYALFYNLYGMYPCHLLDFLKREYGAANAQRQEIFNKSLRPIVESVRLHPLLVTASRQHEAVADRFKTMEHHDIVDECRRFSLEGCERPSDPQFRSRCGTDVAALSAAAPPEPGKASSSAPDLAHKTRLDPDSVAYISKNADQVEPGSERWFSLAEGCAGGAPSAPHTPLPPAYADVPAPRTPLAPPHDHGSPPEAAVEATPENTPIKELVAKRFNFPSNPSTVRALQPALRAPPATHAPTSQPPSPLKKESSPLMDLEPVDRRHDHRLMRVVLERHQADQGREMVHGAPESPLPIGAGAPAAGTTDWPLAKPQPQRHTQNTNHVELDANKEDREVRDITTGMERRRQRPAAPAPASALTQRLRHHSTCAPDSSARRALAAPAAAPRVPARAASCPALVAAPVKRHAHTQTVDTLEASLLEFLSALWSGDAEVGGAAGGTRPLVARLERCVEALAGAAEPEQLRLATAQLEFERHRREVHAGRSRRLLGKCREARTAAEGRAESDNKIRALKRENDELRAQVARQSAALAASEGGARAALAVAHAERVAHEDELRAMRRARDALAAELEQALQAAAKIGADRQSLLAAKLELEARLERALRAGEASDRLAECVRTLQRELFACGEREARLAEAAAARAPHACTERLLRQYREEAESAAEALLAATARLDTATAHAAELEARLGARDHQVLELKRHERAAHDRHDAVVQALHDKYACLLRINQKLECRVLELLRSAAGAAAGGSTGSVPSPHSSPLSASLASSAGPLAATPALSDVAHLHTLLDDADQQD